MIKANSCSQLLVAAALALSSVPMAQAADSALKRVDQGPNWTAATWKDFYSHDQGSRIMPLKWMQALTQPNGKPFLADSLSRYGYLPNPDSPTPGLAVGFTTNNYQGETAIGMTCAACHTREITVDGAHYRIDGGPAIVDFQSFMADLDTTVGRVLANSSSFAAFAVAVLGPNPSSADVAALKTAVSNWYTPYHTLVERSLPTPPWGVARLDAVSMIFNRLTGLDIGKKKDLYLIPENIQKAVAPVRYPFLWNASIQDITQWPGFADNGNDLLGLARNLGEVYGVFGEYHPKPYFKILVDYLATNSANFSGLNTLEDLINPDKLGAPKWPWALDTNLVAKGKEIFDRPTGSGGCQECHAKRPGTTRFYQQETWATPILDVGTDSREHDLLGRVAKTGILKGARKALTLKEFWGECASSFELLSSNVVGAIIQEILAKLTKTNQADMAKMTADTVSQLDEKLKSVMSRPEYAFLKYAFKVPTKKSSETCQAENGNSTSDTEATPPSYAYESRVMDGIWAAAPYLHNGSVPTLWDLLQPVQDRPVAFPVGPEYDTVKVGLAATQTRFNYTLQTTDCYERNSGDSRCGHEYGTSLTTDEKKALLEYLKSL
jgi:hypothetical protein